MSKRLVKTFALAAIFAFAVFLFPTRAFAAETTKDITAEILSEAQRDAYAQNVMDTYAAGDFPNGSKYGGGGMCYGFAKMMIGFIFGATDFSWEYDGSGGTNMQSVARLTEGEYTYENLCAMFSQARPGDALQVSAGNGGGLQHSMVFYGYYPSENPAETYIRVYDANGDGAMTIQMKDLYFDNAERPNQYVFVGVTRGSMGLVRLIPAQTIALNHANTTLETGQSFKLAAQVAPAIYQEVSYASSDSNVVTVSASGRVTAKAPGNATIYVSTRNGGVTKECTVNVVAPASD